MRQSFAMSWFMFYFKFNTLEKLRLPVFILLALKMEAVCSSETLVSTDKSTWRHNPENYRHTRNYGFNTQV
jgi:hypothetical protein